MVTEMIADPEIPLHVEKPLPFKVRLAQVRAALDYVAKRGKNEFYHYSYATAGDIQGIVGRTLATHGIITSKRNQMIEWGAAKTSKGTEETVCRLTAEFGLIDAYSEESIWIPMYGEGRDSADKAYYKAATGARKYALIDALCLGIGDDPEATDDAEHNTPPTKVKTPIRTAPDPPAPPAPAQPPPSTDSQSPLTNGHDVPLPPADTVAGPTKEQLKHLWSLAREKFGAQAETHVRELLKHYALTSTRGLSSLQQYQDFVNDLEAQS